MQFSEDERQIFYASMEMSLGHDSTTLFWVDKWMEGKSMKDVAPNLFVLISKKPRKKRTVREALVERRWIANISGALSLVALSLYVEIWTLLQGVHLSQQSDRMIWR